MRHDPYGPSTHPMMVKCPAYSSDSVENVHTIKGTEKHKIVEQFLDPKSELYTTDTDILGELMGESNEMREPDAQMDGQDINDVECAIEQAREFIRDAEDRTAGTTCNNIVKVFTEKWIDLNILGIAGGTPDLVIQIGESTIIIIDFKFGSGLVSPQSEQLCSYQAGLDPFVSKFKHRYNVIIQPRVYDEPQVFRVTDAHLTSHIMMMKEVIELAKLDNPPYLVHDKCHWCNKHMKCPATVGQLAKAKDMQVKNKNIQIHNLPSDTLAKYVQQYEVIKNFGGALKQELYSRLHRGEEVNGYELGTGRKSRHFHDDAVDTLVKECINKGIDPNDLYDSKLMSVAKIEKLLGKKVINGLWYHQDGKLTVKRKK